VITAIAYYTKQNFKWVHISHEAIEMDFMQIHDLKFRMTNQLVGIKTVLHFSTLNSLDYQIQNITGNCYLYILTTLQHAI
jgi:hypothetical protein